MEEPGGLSDLGTAGQAAWEEVVTELLPVGVRSGRHPFLMASAEPGMKQLASPDWGALPARVVRCLGRARALRALDLNRMLQEEYVEWRTVREGGRITRVELTTELHDYWLVLAAHEPARTIELVGELSRKSVGGREGDWV
jgi:hypothetical protein